MTIRNHMLQLLPNSVYPKIFIIYHNLIIYTILRTVHLQFNKKHHHHGQIFTYRLGNQSNKEPASNNSPNTSVPRSLLKNQLEIRQQLKFTPSWSNWMSWMETDTDATPTLITLYHYLNHKTIRALSPV